eukprot:4486519-Amphidinium_carterae.1
MATPIRLCCRPQSHWSSECLRWHSESKRGNSRAMAPHLSLVSIHSSLSIYSTCVRCEQSNLASTGLELGKVHWVDFKPE